jgi:FlaA1/EpsC-like NDP-sugar epimerase
MPVTSRDAATLLGREPIRVDVDASYVAHQRVLVTGAGGSIGSELCRQLAGHDPAELVMLDRDESALHALQLSLTGRALLDDPQLVLADIRDAPRIREVFEQHRPQVVFHAAALKHQPLLELHPAEAVKTNIAGTATVLNAAAMVDTQVLVNISTDKAADPSCVLGETKRAAEQLTAAHAPRRYISVRFGNVLGSRGSVLDTFAAQIADGRRVTVTHPDISRYFMTVTEAVALVIHAGAIGQPGQALILDMGEPVRIVDIARRMATAAGCPDIPIVYTGLRPGEKLHETLFGAGEQDARPIHPLISHVQVPPLPMPAWPCPEPRRWDLINHVGRR